MAKTVPRESTASESCCGVNSTSQKVEECEAKIYLLFIHTIALQMLIRSSRCSMRRPIQHNCHKIIKY